MSNEILELFEGLTPEQLKEFRKRLVPALTEIRDELVKRANKISYDSVSVEHSNIKSGPLLQVVAGKSKDK